MAGQSRPSYRALMDGVRGRLWRSERRPLVFGALLLVVAFVLVLVLERAGAFSPLAGPVASPAPVLPGVTVEPDPADAVPVVTSLRSDGEAERRGVQVGDRIAAVDGEPVADVAALRAAIERHDAARAVALHLRRGNRLWTVAIPRGDPAAADDKDQPAPAHDS